MQKAINIQETTSSVARVLSIADPAIIDMNPTDRVYFIIDDYEEAPAVVDAALDINYPMYDKNTQKFYWVQIHYQTTANEEIVRIESLASDANKTAAKVNEIDAQINPVPQTFAEKQEFKQIENNRRLAEFLAVNPLLWTDGEFYGVSQEDQNELALNFNQYQLAVTAGQEVQLQWHPKHKACRDFTVEEFTGLVLAIKEFVYPYVQKCQEYKTQIFAATTEEELDAIVLAYVKPEVVAE